MYDIIIQNGTLIDGTGGKMYTGDLGIRDGRIKAIGYLRHDAAEAVLDASGCYVAPGFIDLNNHSDTYWQLFLNPGLPSLLYQGVTTIVGGNSGASLAPLVSKATLQAIQKWTDIRRVNLDWLTMREFLRVVEGRSVGLNFATLVGHTTLRRGLLKDEIRPLTNDELSAMQRLLKQALREGAWGVSFGLAYTHAKAATQRELLALARLVGKHNGYCAIHLRDEGADIVRSIEEALLLARESGTRFHISHLKAVGEPAWKAFERVLYLLEIAQSEAWPVSFDVYPYCSTASVLYTFLPDWVTDGGKQMMLERLKRPEMRRRAIEELKTRRLDYTKATLLISSLSKVMMRQNVGEMAMSQHKAPEEILLDILVASEGRAIISFELLKEDNVVKGLQHPLSVVSSNGAGYSVEHATTGENVHPRSFGAFTRVLERYVRQEKLLSWEEAIHKMTARPARILGMSDRGILRAGMRADIAVFHPEIIEETATFESPYQYARGMQHVLINGKQALVYGAIPTATRQGQVLRPPRHWWQPWWGSGLIPSPFSSHRFS